MARKLKNIEVEEISLVDKAANSKTFYITKQRRQQMDKFIELIKSFLGKKINDEEIAKAKALPETTVSELEPALKTLEEYRDEFSDDVFGAIQDLSKAAILQEERVEEIDFLVELTDVEKAGARLSKATIEQLKKMGEIISGLIGAAEKAIGKTDDEKLPDHVVAKLEKLKKLEDKQVEDAETAAAAKEQKLQETIDDLTKKVAKLEKRKPLKKQIEGQEGNEETEEEEEGGEEENLWPSLTSETEDEE
jgi:hypothetical protein